MGINISTLECLFILMEFIFGTVILTAMWRSVLRHVLPTLLGDVITTNTTYDFFYSYSGSMSLMFWLIARLGWGINKDFYPAARDVIVSFYAQIVYLLNLVKNPTNVSNIIKLSTQSVVFDVFGNSAAAKGENKHANPNNNNSLHLIQNVVVKQKSFNKGLYLVKIILLTHVASMVFMLGLQAYTGVEIYSFDNFMVSYADDAALIEKKDQNALFEDVLANIELDMKNTTTADATPSVSDVENKDEAIIDEKLVVETDVPTTNTTTTTTTEAVAQEKEQVLLNNTTQQPEQQNTTTTDNNEKSKEEKKNNTDEQNKTDNENKTDEKFFAWTKLLQLLVLSPIIEEVIFRCIMLTLVHLRITKYYPGRIELNEALDGIINKKEEKSGEKKKKIVVRKKKQDKGDDVGEDDDKENVPQQLDDDLENVPQQDNGGVEKNEFKLALIKGKKNQQLINNKIVKLPFINIAQLSTLVSAIAFGGIHILNILNGDAQLYVIIQAIIGSLIGIVLNATAYHTGHALPLVLHVVNNISASLVSTKISILDEKYYCILLIGYIETILCYLVFAYIAITSLSTSQDEDEYNLVDVKKDGAKNQQQNILYYNDEEKKALQKHTEDVAIPHQYNAFNNTLIRVACYQNKLPCQ